MSRASARANDPTNGRVAPGVTRRPIRSEPAGPRQPSWDGGSCAARSDRGHSMVPTLPSAWAVGSCAARSDRGHSMVPTLPSARLRSALFMATANPEPLSGSPTPAPDPMTEPLRSGYLAGDPCRGQRRREGRASGATAPRAGCRWAAAHRCVPECRVTLEDAPLAAAATAGSTTVRTHRSDQVGQRRDRAGWERRRAWVVGQQGAGCA
jgi:hypothetical protein